MNQLTNVVQLTNDVESARAAYQYDSAGRLWKKIYGNGDIVTCDYDSESRLLSLFVVYGTYVTKYTYAWNAAGNLLVITNLAGSPRAFTSQYAYDAAGQLTNEIVRATTNAWVYDEAGWLFFGAR